MKRSLTNVGAFSLIEMVMVLALITLLATLAVLNLSNVYDTADTIPTEELLSMSVKEARYRALLEKESVRLAYNPETTSFEVRARSGNTLVEIPTDHDKKDNPLRVVFKVPVPPRGMPLSLTHSFSDSEYREVSGISFSANTVANPFIVELHGNGPPEIFRFDPFSNVRLAFDEDS